MSTHQPISRIPKKTLERLLSQLSGELPATEVARLFDIPISKVTQRQKSSTAPTLRQTGLYRPPREQPPVKTNQQLTVSQQLTQTLQHALEMSASPTCR